MAGPFIFIATNRLKAGKLQAERRRVPGLVEFIEANEPRLIAFNEYTNEEGTEVGVVQVHPDTDSFELHMEVVRERAARAYEETLDATTGIQVFGTPTDTILEMLARAAGGRSIHREAAPPGRIHAIRHEIGRLATAGEGGSMSDANKELVRRHFEEIFNRKSLDACDELLAEDYVENAVSPFGSAPPGRVNGPAAMRGTAQWLIGQFPDIHMTIEAIVADGDLVACRIESAGTNLGPMNPMVPATGKRFSARQSHWFRIKGDKLA